MTDGGLGVAFFSPFDNHRYFLPWTPIRVSPIGAGRFFTHRGLEVLQSEFLWIWLPAAVLAIAAWVVRRPASSKLTPRSEEHTSELQSHLNIVCRLLLVKKKKNVSLYRYA